MPTWGFRGLMVPAAHERRISSINGSGHQISKWLGFLFNSAVKTCEGRGVLVLLWGLSCSLGLALFVPF